MVTRISVVMTSYNQGAFIEQALLSVLGLGYPNLELIVMDGVSTDETVSILE
jgi:glycosyltransferase involved in cell wall biosynthesis